MPKKRTGIMRPTRPSKWLHESPMTGRGWATKKSFKKTRKRKR